MFVQVTTLLENELFVQNCTYKQNKQWAFLFVHLSVYTDL